MSNKNDEIRQYPLVKINKMRIKDEKRKQILKYILTGIASVLIFCIGFASGFYFGAPDKKDTVAVSGDAATLSGSGKSADAKSGCDADGASQESAKAKDETQKLEELKSQFINTVSQKYPSVDFSFAIKNLDTGAYIIHNNKQMNSASVIKLFIMETIYDQASKGAYDLTEEKQLDLSKMITESDNDASNGFIDDFGGEDENRKVTDDNIINQTIKDGGYAYTQINRKMHDTTPPGGPTGYENYTSAEDVLLVLEGIYNKTLFDEPYNSQALSLLKSQHRRAKIPAKITEQYPDVVVANKTGELSQVENDAALIMCEDFNLAFVVFVNEIPKKADGSTDYDLKEQVQVTISELGLELVDFYKTNEF